MRSTKLTATLFGLFKAGVAASMLLTAGEACFAQAVVNLTAKASTALMPDGQSVPMWGYTCTAAANATVPAANATCAATNPAAGANWSPVVITVPAGQLQINLTNNLPAPVPTSLVIVGQLGGGLGNAPTTKPGPAHPTQTATTWPIVSSTTAPPTPYSAPPAAFTPPAQGPRIESFGTEVAPTIDPKAYTTLTWTNLKPGTYLLESGTHPSIQGPMGLYGVLVVKSPSVPSSTCASTNQAYPGTATCYDADVPLVMGEIDPVQNAAVAAAVATKGFSETAAWSGQPGGCGDSKSVSFGTCYPPVVNYDPRYYLINGVAFDRTNPNASAFLPSANVAASTGQVLVRFVNAGLRMHIPAVVGAQTGNPAVPGFSLVAEDGNVLPGNPRIQNAVFMAAGKTYDVMLNAPAAGALPVYDRELSLSTNNQRDGGMQGYIAVNNALPSATPGLGETPTAAGANYFFVPGTTLTVSDPAKGVIAKDSGVYGVKVQTAPATGTLTLNTDGTFTYLSSSAANDSFVYQSTNGTPPVTATVTLTACTAANGCLSTPTAGNASFTSNIASRLQVGAPGVLASANDPAGLPLTAQLVGAAQNGAVTLNPDGSFTATPTTPPLAGSNASAQTVTFQYNVTNTQNQTSKTAGTVTVTFNPGSGLVVNVMDAPSMAPDAKAPNKMVQLTDYRWIIEEDRTMQIDPACQVNSATSRPANCPPLPVPSLGTNFHTSYMPVVASGCVGTVACESGQTVYDPVSNTHLPTVCDVGNGVCRTGANVTQQTAVDPKYVALDPTKHYYISILPGDAGNTFSNGGGVPFNGARQFSIAQDCPSGPSGADFAPGTGKCGHSMGGAPIAPAQIAAAQAGQTAAGQAGQLNVLLTETPYPTAKLSVFVFEDDAPLNGEVDVSGGSDGFGTAREPGLGGFEIKLWDDAGGTGDPTGQMSYDMFNMPLSNSLQGTIDPLTGLNACPITTATDGLVGMIPTCPKYESDGKTLSPLVGQAVIANLMPGRYGVVATPAADRIGRGEEWLQTNTLDGQKAHDAFIKVGGPAYFQEFGPAGYHVSVGFANPKIINARRTNAGKTGLCDTGACPNSIKGHVTNLHYSRPPNENLYGSGTRDSLAFTQCYVSVGDPDGEDYGFTKCDSKGNFEIDGLPSGTTRITIFDQWNDQIVDGLAKAVQLPDANGNTTVDVGEISVLQWQTNLYTRTFIDLHGDGISHPDDPGIALASVNMRFRDGSYSSFNATDANGYAPFNEVFPLFNWYVVDDDMTRFKPTGTHVVYDAGGPVDGTGIPGSGNSTIAKNFANTVEAVPVPSNLQVPGAKYCADADCASTGSGSTGRVDPPWVTSEAWQGFSGQNSFIEYGKTPFAKGENGGIRGEVIYASTRPFDDPTLLIHTKWTPDVPNVTVNLYQEGTAADGTANLTLVDTTRTTSWDDWAQGFRADGVTPNMNCPGQNTSDPFYFTLQNSTNWLDPQHRQLPANAQFKCYDGMHVFNQIQPAPYDGAYKFPSVTATDSTGKPVASNCTICVGKNPVDGTPMLPAGKYVVEIIVPPGYELVKEEDKNILIGDNYIAPVTQQFGGIGNVYIIPDQAAVNSSYNRNNAQNPTTNLGSTPHAEGDTGSVERFWPCVGELRIVPDYMSIFPGSKEVAPFAGASRHLCDRKEVVLTDEESVLAKFWIFSSTHVSAHYTGFMLDDFSSEFDPYSPQFGEKFAVPNVPISFKDYSGNEISRTYSDQWGIYNGLTFSTWEVNPPNPTGYAPTMMVTCMNDPGPIPDPNNPGKTMTDPLYNPAYSQFCYEIPFMPGQTQYMDTPVVPVQAFADGYNQPDCAYPDATPAISSVTGDAIGAGAGPWVSAPGNQLTINALGDQQVTNNAYTGPSQTTAPFNQKFITRHYGFGNTQGSGSVTIAGVNAPVVSWSDQQIVVTVPDLSSTIPPLKTAPSTCTIQQMGAPATQCGELVITAGNGKRSIDTVTVTIGGKTPTYINGENGASNAIQSAIDSASAGDMIVVGPGTYNEMLVMWKPVRLQGVGAASVKINANTHPSGKLDPWRRLVSCLFGTSLDGGLITSTYDPTKPISPTNNPYDPSGTYQCPAQMQGHTDPIPFEPTVGWDGMLNGNLGELLMEPSLMGAYEGAGITVLGKGVQPSTNCTANGVCTLLTASDCTTDPNNPNYSNFLCNPSRIDGLTFTNSSQGGGGIFLHGWNHYTEVSNNRVTGNAGTLTGGITIGQVEVPDGTIASDGVTQLPFMYNTYVNVHHNAVTGNASYGDEINSTTPSSAGGVTFCSGADYYRFNYNWVCGNISSGDGGGVAHFGFSYNGDLSHNVVLFNQSNNPTLPTYGGGIIAQGVPPDGTFCENSLVDLDCAPQLSDGVGPGLVIDGNLIMGNTAEGGKGGGLRLQNVNGTDVQRSLDDPDSWYEVNVINNIIADNVAGWSGGGVSLQDAVRVNFINNTVIANDATASAGVLFNTPAAAQSNVLPPGCTTSPNSAETTCTGYIGTSTIQPAGLETATHSQNLMTAFTPPAGFNGTVTCPDGEPNCMNFSNPVLTNNLFWQNRSFYITVSAQPNPNIPGVQNAVTLNPDLNQKGQSTGFCVTGGQNPPVYWDIGAYGDTGPTTPQAAMKMNPQYSIMTDTTGYDASNIAADPQTVSQYCNGSRVPPEAGGNGFAVPPGIADAVLPNPLFGLLPSATPDEGNQWINMSYGPLSLFNAALTSGQAGYNVMMGNYSITAGSPAVGAATGDGAPNHDIFGTPRPSANGFDIGAVEYVDPGLFGGLLGGGPIDPLALGSQQSTLANLFPLGLGRVARLLGGGVPRPQVFAPALRRLRAGALRQAPAPRRPQAGALTQRPALARPQSGALLQAPAPTPARNRAQALAQARPLAPAPAAPTPARNRAQPQARTQPRPATPAPAPATPKPLTRAAR
ncbi:choice-of-anchor Q domain-containing protein [Burkholderia ubonensis]|uniref:choice-of-anchor Q domain-containing protein n=1 Tax=Burkholderia ubonensis TaxID=101571 RepID=UPI000A46D12D|nr:choice-of-anchor Q domain-containing protein [Burkholderia ubonensis]